MQVRDIHDQMRTVGKVLENGGSRKSAASFEFDAAGNCQNPKRFEIIGRPSGAFRVVAGEFSHDKFIVVDGKKTPIPLFVDGKVRCRKCKRCLQYRTRHWASRAQREIDVGVRTWFTTLTLRPDRAFYFLELMRERRWTAGVDADADQPDERFRQWSAEVGIELTRFIKRVRKNSGANLRYIFVFERHRSGTPHIHGLIHERGGDNPVTKRTLEAAWHEGFSHCRLVDKTARTAWYVCKYLSKDAAARIRASVRYGRIEIGGTPQTARPKAIDEQIKSEVVKTNDPKGENEELTILPEKQEGT